MLNGFDSLTFVEFFIVMSAANVAMYVVSWVVVKLAQRIVALHLMDECPISHGP